MTDPHRGAPRYLEEIRAASGQFETALRTLSGASVHRVAWPSLPSKALVQEIREWWDQQRAPWSRSIHGFYRKVGEGVAWPFQKAYEAVSVPRPDALDTFKRDERNAIVTAVGRLLEELDRLATVGNETLRPRLEAMLAGHARAELLQRVETSHEALPPVDDDYRTYLRNELNVWVQQNPKAARIFHWIDYAAALARPVITVSLAATGILAGADVAGGVVGDTVLTVALTSGGEAAVSSAGEGVKHAAAQLFRRLQSQYIQRRAEWLADWLDQELLGDLLQNLREGAEAPQSPAFSEAVAAVQELTQAAALTESTSGSV